MHSPNVQGPLRGRVSYNRKIKWRGYIKGWEERDRYLGSFCSVRTLGFGQREKCLFFEELLL